MYCSRDCRNTANSQAGAAIRGQQTRERIERGMWVNPASLHAPDPEKVGLGVSRRRKREVASGTWRNPGLTPEARAINSRPRKHSGLLARAMEILRRGRMADLTSEEADVYREYRRQQRLALQAKHNSTL